ncbi:MAG: insulinase family protein [Firmicutes bacterium]|nr:insulinase family protein [Bacillota bacterium]MCM1401275.1 insulinase family protein [Bacteroides sp.]MCM1476770.1 insulinase family protein [Bacteroides sp.]
MTENRLRTTAPRIELMNTFKLPAVERRVLASGIELVIYNGCDVPVTYITYVSRGGYSELASPATGALISILRREGSLKHSGEEINATMDHNGAWLKSWMTDHHSLLSMRSLNSTLPKVLPLFAETIFQPTFPDAPFAVRRDALAKNLEVSLTDVDFLANCAADKQIKGPNHPGARIDSPESVMELTAESLRKSFSTLSQQGTIFLCGNVTDQILTLVEQTFGTAAINNVGQNLNIRPYAAIPAGSEEFIIKEDSMQNAVIATLPAPSRDHPDYIGLHIAVSALGGYFGSRLMLNIREKLGLTYGIAASLLGTADGSYIQIQADTDPKFTRRLLDEVKNELTLMASNPPQGDELMRLKQSLLSGQAAILDSPFSITDYHVTALTSGIPQGYFEAKLEAIASLTSDDIATISSKYLLPENVRVAIAGKKTEPAF